MSDKTGPLVTVFILNHWADCCGLAEWSMTDGFAMESSDGRWLEDLQIRAAISMGRTNRTRWLSLRSHQRCSWFFLASHPKTPLWVVIGRGYRFDIHIFMNQMFPCIPIRSHSQIPAILFSLIWYIFFLQVKQLSPGGKASLFSIISQGLLSYLSPVSLMSSPRLPRAQNRPTSPTAAVRPQSGAFPARWTHSPPDSEIQGRDSKNHHIFLSISFRVF